MKLKTNKIFRLGMVALLGVVAAGCDDHLDITPPSQISPELYFTTADQLGVYTVSYYTSDNNVGSRGSNLMPHHGIGGNAYATFLDDDQGTDNESGTNSRFYASNTHVRVGSGGGSWWFNMINDFNYFLEVVIPRYEAGQISGTEKDIRHYIGEMYTLRAMEYFRRLQALGDFPIITTTLPLDREILTEQSARAPRNKVARFILEDLDRAAEFLSDGSTTGGRNRITRDVALLFKARVALYEATFEKYFAGTPFVPDASAGWPGANKEYNKDFTYNNDEEVKFFLDEALAASGEVCKNHPNLTSNNKKMIGDSYTSMPDNPYYELFCSKDVSSRDEALMYRSYDKNMVGGSWMNARIGGGKGYTQEFANCFLMDNGLPIYDPNSGYKGDDFVADTKEGRDWRWRLFMKAPNEYVYLDSKLRIGEGKKNKNDAELKAPALISGGVDFTTSTGYHKGKGWSKNIEWKQGGWDESAAIIFRSAEAYLIYIEAAWEKFGDNLNAEAWDYWGKLRTRAGLPADPQVTIAATDLDKEEYTSHDLGLYSAGKRITSKVLYNIRRERRCELISEGMRWDDLIRWRALDQLKEKPIYLHGCKIYGPMNEWFTHKSGAVSKFKIRQSDSSKNNVSDPDDIEGGLNGDASYFSLLRVSDKDEWYNSGYSWHMAHYLNPIAEDHFRETSTASDYSDSPIYQNPYWSTTHDTGALQ